MCQALGEALKTQTDSLRQDPNTVQGDLGIETGPVATSCLHGKPPLALLWVGRVGHTPGVCTMLPEPQGGRWGNVSQGFSPLWLF